jgi:hypothetical protein
VAHLEQFFVMYNSIFLCIILYVVYHVKDNVWMDHATNECGYVWFYFLVIKLALYDVSVLMEPLLSLRRILRNGSAFTYLNLENRDRNLSMIKDMNIRWIFSESHVQHHQWTLRKEISVHGCTIALWESDVIRTSCTEAVCSPDEWKMAYTIQTSGTTGYPKIVRVPHRCIVPNIQSLQ